MSTNQKLGGAYVPSGDYTRTGGTDTGGTYAGATLTSPTISGTTTIGSGATITAPTIATPTITDPAITGTTTIGAGATLTTPTIAGGTFTGNSLSGVVVAKTITFTESTSTTNTGTVVIPAGATLLDIYFWSTVLWTAADSAVVIGDANAANGWFTTCQLDTTDLVVGERLQASNPNNWGGVNGAYLTTAGRFGQQSGNMIGGYCPTAYSVIAVVTKSGAGTAGRSFMTVVYAVGQVTAATVT